ncbi:unnamed protein product [Trichobilharzia regenti]|nr:unnamed protein product [Trichobilharzia regenti]
MLPWKPGSHSLFSPVFNKERDAKEHMKQRARELQQARMEAGKRSGMNLSGFSNYRGGMSMGSGLTNDLSKSSVFL